jgi:hypothetical protein
VVVGKAAVVKRGRDRGTIQFDRLAERRDGRRQRP